MSMTQTETTAQEHANYGGFIDAGGGIATIVLTIIGLAGLAPRAILAVAVVVFGAALLIRGAAMLSEYSRISFSAGTTAAVLNQFGGGSLPAIFFGGAVGVILGLLALLDVQAAILGPVAVIVFGSVMAGTCNSTLNVRRLKARVESASAPSTRTGTDILATEMASSSAGGQAIAGLAAVVLGILAVVGTRSDALGLIALLVLGATLVLTGSTLSGLVSSFVRPLA